MRKYELEALCQKSFYRKAWVIEQDNGTIELKSYETIVCKIENGQFVKLWNGYSVTTMNHINDFRRQNGLPKLLKKDWDALPCDNKERYKVVFINLFTGSNFGGKTQFDDYDDADAYGEKVCNENEWRFSYEVVEIEQKGA